MTSFLGKGKGMRRQRVSIPESRTWRVSLTGDAPDGTTLRDSEELRNLLGSKCQLITVKAPTKGKKPTRTESVVCLGGEGIARYDLLWGGLGMRSCIRQDGL